MNSESVEDYIKYLESCSIDEINSLFKNINHERYPVLSQLLKKRIEFLEDYKNKDFTDDRYGFSQKWFSRRTIWYQDKIGWSNLVMGLFIPLVFLTFSMALNGVDYFRYRPWIAFPTFFVIYFVLSVFLGVFSVLSIKKNQLNLNMRLRPLRYFFSEFFKSLLFWFLINIIIGITALVLIKVFAVTPKETILIKIAAFAPNSWHLLLLLIYAVTIGPVIEEVYFRGYLYNALKTRLSHMLSMILQALIFSVVHLYDPFNSFLIFLFGIALTVIYEKRNNLFSPIVIHVFNNALILVPFIFLVYNNIHTPAASFEIAKTNPPWLASSPPSYVEKQGSGQEQYEYALETWGVKGSREWKKEANALRAVSFWFPDDKHSISKSELRVANIFQSCLQDFRRAISVSQSIISGFPDQDSQCASALLTIGWSYYMLKDFTKSRSAFEQVITKYKNMDDIILSAREGLKWINEVE